MPILFKRPVGDGFLAVWRREESTEQLLSGIVLSPAEQASYRQIAPYPKRRKEWLTWHRMIRDFLGPEVHADYDAEGRPVLIGHEGHISISHSNDFVVLYYSTGVCGVDIENCGRRFERVSDRYISPEEWMLPGASRNNRFQALMWCLKETAYKYARTQGLDFIRDIRITHIDIHASWTEVRIRGQEPLRLKYEFIQDHCLAYTY